MVFFRCDSSLRVQRVPSTASGEMGGRQEEAQHIFSPHEIPSMSSAECNYCAYDSCNLANTLKYAGD